MARARNNVASRARRKKRLKLAKGYFGSKHRLYRTANEQVMRSQRYAYVGRKQLKREMRKLWITRINAAARMNDITYSQLMHGLRLADIQINRKMLSEMAIHDEKGFSQLVDIAKKSLDNKDSKAEKQAVEATTVEEATVEEAKEETTYDLDSYGNNWSEVVYNIIDRHVADEFSIEDVLEHQDIAAKIYPKNNTLEATIKRNVTILVNDNKLVEVAENKYKKA